MPEYTRTALVTDATTDTAYDLARRLVRDGHTVILHAADTDSGEQALERLVKNGVEPLHLDLVTANFASLGEVARMARRVTDTHPSLDLLVHTAHIAAPERRVLTEDGNELTFQVNYLAPYLLVRLLEGPLSKPDTSRVVNVSSTLHRGGSINWADPTRGRRYTQLAAYGQSTLAMATFTATLADYWPAGITAVAVDPGTQDRAILRLHGPWVQPHHDTADILDTLATASTVDSGSFYHRLLRAELASDATDSRAQRRLWKLSERLTGLRP